MRGRRLLRAVDRAAGVVVWAVFAAGFLGVGTLGAVMLGARWWAPLWGVAATVVGLVLLRFFSPPPESWLLWDPDDLSD